MNRYLIIADDFTGSNDTGVQVRRCGIPVSVVFSGQMVKENGSFVIDTESRALLGSDARARLRKSLEGLNCSTFDHIMKKVDSTIRGNIAIEIKEIDELLDRELVIFAPALPDLGRTTEIGVHKLKGTPIAQTELSRDPKTPVREDNIQVLLQEVYEEPVVHIGLDLVERGQIDLSCGRVFTFDAVTNHHLQNIILAALKTKKRVLWAGTAAMADNLLAVECKPPPALAVVASLSSLTRSQVRYAERQGSQVIQVPIHQLLDKKEQAETCIRQGIEILKTGKDVIVTSASAYTPEALPLSNEAGQRAGLTEEQVSNFTQMIIGEIARKILEAVEVSGVFLTGGDTAMGFFSAVEALGSSILTEVEIGIPMMQLRGGPFKNTKIITKAGAFGREESLAYALRKLKEVIL